MHLARSRISLGGLAMLLCASCTGSIGGVLDPPPDDKPDAGEPISPGTSLLLSEIMYHPVLEDAFEDWHEFIEIHNPQDREVSLEGWSLAGDVDYAFPAGSKIPAGGYVVVARSREALLGMPEYGLDPALVFGDWAGGLDNGGGNVLLRAPDQRIADSVEFDDQAPWPEAADAMGAGDEWLRSDLLPLDQHRYRGYSLERVSFGVEGNEIANWDVSPLDEPSPGKANHAARAVPRAIVLSASAAPRASDDPLIRAADEVLVRVRVSRIGGVDAVELEHYVDDLERVDEAIETTALRDDGAAGDELAGDRIYSAVLPPRPDNSIVRYRVRVTGDGETRQASPRPSAPFAWHAYFVNPVVDTTSATVHLFISTQRWTEMWNNIEPGRMPQECTPNPAWDGEVPAVLVHDGKVYDVLARHQGSRYNRTIGAEIRNWPGAKPAEPDPLRALSWHIDFPRYARFEGRRVLTLNKLIQTCPGLTAGVGMQLFANAEVPASRTRYVRVHVNGYYYRYMLDIEHPTQELLERYHEEQAARHPGKPEYEVGHLFKATGADFDEGPWGPADGRLFGPACGYSPEERYANSYERKTHDWMGPENLIEMIEGLHQARGQGRDALRAYLTEHFDVDTVLSYLAVMNWSVPFDDLFHNYYLYQRLEDGKWLLIPWDLDVNFGDWKGERDRGPRSSIYMGEEGDPDNRNGWWNYFKDSFLDAYRAEFEQRLRELNQTVLHPDRVSEVVDAVAGSADPAEAAQSLSGVSCDYGAAAQNFKQFARERHDFVTSQLGLPQ
jgi:hypothetical protein